MHEFQHILIVRGGAIGDFILTMPVLAALREEFPTARLELLANPAVASLAVHFGLADKVRDLGSASFAPLFAENGTCPQEIAAWLSRFDLVISYAHDPHRIFETNIRRHTNAKFVAAPHRPNDQQNRHASVQLLEPLSDIISPSFDVGSWKLDVARSPSPSTIAIHPGSGSPAKNWPAEKCHALLEHLVATTDDKFFLLGGEAERNTLPDLAKLIPGDRRQVALELPLVELAERLKECRVFIGHDSGPTHLGAILGLDCIVLWGPSNHHVWRPLGERVQILQHAQGLRDLPVETVVNALNSLLTAP